MTELETTTEGGLQRRTVLKGAAWSVPVIAAAVGAPLAAASVANSSLDWTGTASNLASVQLLSGGTVNLAAGILMSLPDAFTLTNGGGALNASATVTIVVGRPDGVSLTVGTAHGFGVYKYNNVVVSGLNTVAYQQTGLGTNFGYPITTYTASGVNFTAGSNGSVIVPVQFGLSGTSTVAVGVLTTFPVTLTVAFAGKTYTATTSIQVPVGAGIL